MLTRRNFLQGAALLGAGHCLDVHAARAADATSADSVGKGSGLKIIRRDDTLLRLGGMGDGYNLTWAADDRQYFGINDGVGWKKQPLEFWNTHMWSVAGMPSTASFADVTTFPDLNKMLQADEDPSYYSFGALAARGRIYQFMGTLDDNMESPRHWIGAKLVYSPDGGKTWRNQNGTPVTWESRAQHTRDHMAFMHEPNNCFSLLSFLQMGRDYAANRDGYAYVYSPNGNVDGQMNQLVMARVPVARITDRDAYEYFAGHAAKGKAHWVKNIEARAVVHTFPRGWVNYTNLFPGDLVVESWLPSVVYNEPLGLYLMVNAGLGCSPDGKEYGKPSYLGFWVAENPWGPWQQIHEEQAWTPGNDPAARTYAPRIAPKWIAADGKSFWLVWPDLQGLDTFARHRSELAAQMGTATTLEQRTEIITAFHRRYLPNYGFNTQRVDLVW